MAKLGGWHSCIKYLLFAFNFLFWLLGLAILAIGIWIVVDPSSIQRTHTNEAFDQFLQNSSTFGYQLTGAAILIAVAAIVIVVGFLGCCGAIKENQCMLGTFFVLLAVIFIVLLAAGIAALVAKNNMRNYIRDRLERAVHSYNNDTNSKALMDFVQANFKCCGATDAGAMDYAATRQIPSSCANYIAPCPESVFRELTPNLIVIAGVAVGIAIVLLMGMAFSLTLCCAIRASTL